MKTLAIIIVALFLASGLSAQENATNKEVVKTEKQKRKAARDSAFANEYLKLKGIIDSMSFVLEADYLYNQWGYRIWVPSELNFIMVDSSEVVIQTGNNSGVGYNGVGGVTVEGTISGWKVKKDPKNSSFFITMEVNSINGFYTVFIDISANGRASATLSGLRPGRLTWDGWVQPLYNTSTYQGMSTVADLRHFPPAARMQIFHRFSRF
ncbi:MAG: DUF4251 domain-containing protein [Bacteroidota bacterium]|nr:DUF4251 domain-containing protein [Bacteroidota bacterium]